MWVSGTGALLLLAAAATFLAVTWDALGLAARVAVVATVTATAIAGGHRLRGRLPAVGAVVFHLGAALLPVDALGLALQLDLDPALTWLLVGAVAVVALPPLAVVGGSTALAWGAVAGVPVTATGVGLLTAMPAPPLVAAAALAVALLAAPAAVGSGPRRVASMAGPVLAVAAVHIPLLATIVAPVLRGAAAGQIAGAGWVASSWVVPLATGVVAMGALARSAARTRSRLIAGAAIVTGASTVVVTLLPPDTPTLAQLLALPVAALAAQLAALAAGSDRVWGPVTRIAAVAAEIAGAVLVPLVVTTALVPAAWSRLVDPLELAAAVGVGAVAWLAAGVRRDLDVDRWEPPVVTVLAGLHVAGATALLWPAQTVATVVVLLAGAATTLVWTALPRPGGQRRLAAAVAAVVMLGVALAAAWATVPAHLVAAVAAGVVGLHVRAVIRAGADTATELAAVLLPLAALIVLAAPFGTVGMTGVAAPWDAVLAAAVAGASLLALAASADGLPVGADALRVVAALVAVVAVRPDLPAAGAATSGAEEQLLSLFGLTPTALLPVVLVTGWLALDAARLDRPRIATLAAPAAVRTLALAAYAVTGGPVGVGVAALAAGVGAAAVATLGARRWRVPTGVFAGLSALVAWIAFGDTPLLLAWMTVAVGVVIATLGALRRRPVVAHVGGAVAVLGVWQHLTLAEIDAIDLWLLPVAAQLWAAGIAARRRGTSSWIADVPPLLLVTIPALIERLAGGPGWHAVLGGGLALGAVVLGGSRRLAGPLVVGSVALLATVLVETLAVVAMVPTWAWLALGGVVLLGVGVAIERIGQSPAAAARRLVDVVGERFD